ncbi:MAG: polyamine aminopropyltransferase [bacterium]
MDLWFSEEFISGYRLSFRVTKTLCARSSRFQKIDVIETEAFGRMLLLDGHVMFSERDEFVYHEMMVHPPMQANPDAQRVCVVGGGDGGTVRELIKYPQLKSIVLCEIDEEVIRVCKEFFPKMTASLSDPRVTVTIEDAVDYISRQSGEYDIIVGDTMDPTGPAVALFEEPFFASIKRALQLNGTFVQQIETVFSKRDVVRKVVKALGNHFQDCRLYGASIPTYPTGYWNFLWASDGVDPYSVDEKRQQEVAATCQYYTAEHQRAAFAVPAFSRGLLA